MKSFTWLCPSKWCFPEPGPGAGAGAMEGPGAMASQIGSNRRRRLHEAVRRTLLTLPLALSGLARSLLANVGVAIDADANGNLQ